MRLAALLFAVALAAVPAASQQRTKPATDTLPPMSYVCPMTGDEDVIEDKPGKCRKCGMTLVPVRLDSVWTCATRPLLVVETKPGKCPVDGTALVQVTTAVSWTCKSDPTVDAIEPATCPDGTAMIKKYAARAHGNHNPQHGGQFFMASDSWHHVEGAYLPSGIFRLYLYDDFTRPLPLNQVRQVSARVVTKQTFDAATKATKEITAVPLVRNGRHLEARVGKLPLPAQMSAKVTFEPSKPENLFDFTFETFSKEPVAAPRLTNAMPSMSPPSMPTAIATPGATTAAAGTAATPDPAAPSSGVDPALIPVPIPETVPEMLTQLRTRTEQIRAFIDRGSFASIYVPAFQAKDLALALDEHKQELPADRRRIAEPAIARLVRSAYLLDAFGDVGNKQQISEAYEMFTAAVKEIEASFPAR